MVSARYLLHRRDDRQRISEPQASIRRIRLVKARQFFVAQFVKMCLIIT